VRELSTRLGDTASSMEKIVFTLVESIGERRRDGAGNDTTPEELRLELGVRAREALAALMGAMGTSVQGSDDVRRASAALRDQLDEAFVHFQFGDRVSQIFRPSATTRPASRAEWPTTPRPPSPTPPNGWPRWRAVTPWTSSAHTTTATCM
jgi:hypothetical protein